MGKFNRASFESMELDLPQSLLFLPIRFCLQRAKGSSLPFWFAASGPRSGYLENILRPRRRVCRRLAYPANLPMRHQTNNMITEIKNFFRASLDYTEAKVDVTQEIEQRAQWSAPAWVACCALCSTGCPTVSAPTLIGYDSVIC